MAKQCEICGKSARFSKYGIHKHSGQWRYRAPATTKKQKPNLIKAQIFFGGRKVRALVCAKCLKAQLKIKK